MQSGVQTQVAKYKIDSSVSVEIAGHDAVPPPRAVLESLGRESDQRRTGIVKNGNRHPFAYDDEIETAVAVDVNPQRVRHLSDLRQVGRDLRRHVREPPGAV